MCQRSRKGERQKVEFDLQCLPVWGLASCTSDPKLWAGPTLSKSQIPRGGNKDNDNVLWRTTGTQRRLRGGEKRKSTVASMAPLTQALCELLHRKEKLPRTRRTQELEQRTLPFPRHGVQGPPQNCSGCCQEWALSVTQHKAWVLVNQGQFCS